MVFYYAIIFLLAYAIDKGVKYYEKRKKQDAELKELKEIQFFSIPFEWVMVETGEKLIKSDIYKEALWYGSGAENNHRNFDEPLLIYCPIHDCSEYVRTYEEILNAVTAHEIYVKILKDRDEEIERKQKLEDDARKLEELKKKIRNN